jgi:hypothetical protein
MIPLCLALRYVNISQNKRRAIALSALIEANGWTEEDVKRESDRTAVSPISPLDARSLD